MKRSTINNMSSSVKKLIVVFFCLIICLKSFSQIIQKGSIVYVSDGDTFHFVADSGEKLKIRLEGVDCPETTQPYGLEAKQYVISLILNKTVEIKLLGKDQYGRIIARLIFDDNKDLSKILLQEGYAWHFKKYNIEEELAMLEAGAKEQKKGLWAKPNYIPPWEYRKLK